MFATREFPEDARTPDESAAVAVVTDSTTYLPRPLVERWAIHEVSLYVGWDGDLQPEHQYDDLDAFYARLRESSVLPTTSQPSVGDFVACFEPLVSAGRDVVSIHLASGLSGTCEAATEAARIVSGHLGSVEVVDGQTGAGGLGCLVIAAARAAERGAELNAVVDAARRSARAASDVVLPGHAGISASRREDRGRTGDAGDGAEGEADPDLRERDRPGRPRTNKAPGGGADGRLPG